MDVREFTKTVREELPDFLPDDVYEDLIIEDVEISKMNDQRLHGLIFRVKGSDAAPTLYIDDLHERHENGEDLGYLLVELANRYEGARHAPAPPDVDLTWDRVRENLSVRLIEKQRNRDFLRERPYVDVGNGLALICDINMGEDRGGDWRVNINRSLLESFGVDTESLFAEALNRAPEIEPPVLTDMGQALFSPDKVNLLEGDIHIAPEDLGNMYVLTNEAGTFGAAALFYPDIKEKTAEILGSGYYVLPSSVHEVILVPEAAGINEKELCDMVKQANRTVVEPQDVLSDNVLHYDRDERRLDKVIPEHERGDRVAEAR